ncbi:anthranilate phosphoribosyltransferase [Bacillus sp. FJAT-42376]|uniref:anthranilate phosphoribosyltransferase n=1 Tax=Bacillus sp. FJAT-42376 TaxID=2014076 RepID=UPI000F4F49F3|nr:anthranilate phosphoribosyltransferase [Bacillus sp. FJAT-42376]AZB43332.1 anthranilate phosphoribosyltransferase [Bacillus sp. FJAT-42376]
MMKSILSRAVEGERFTRFEAKEAMRSIMEGRATEAQIASFLSILRLRGETVEEIIGFTEAMKEKMVVIKGLEDAVDTCGTGGDQASTFNISTSAAITASSFGVKVAKHGNRSFTSKSGSADVLEALDIKPLESPCQAAEELGKYHMGFLFAPLYHTSMKHAVNPRKEIGFRTAFNLLGPLANPANASKQVIGVFSERYAQLMAEALCKLGTKHALLVTGADGLDEITVTDETMVLEVKGETISRYTISPEQFGMSRGNPLDLKAGSPQESAAMICKAFQNRGPQAVKDIISLNAGAALYASGYAQTLNEGVQLSEQAIISGQALAQLQKLQKKKVEKYA